MDDDGGTRTARPDQLRQGERERRTKAAESRGGRDGKDGKEEMKSRAGGGGGRISNKKEKGKRTLSAGDVSDHREAVQGTRHHPNPSSGGDVNASLLPPGACSPRFHCCSPAPSRLLPLRAAGCGLPASLRALAGPCSSVLALLWVVQPGPEPLPANFVASGLPAAAMQAVQPPSPRRLPVPCPK